MTFKIFIDGGEGTTGLKIRERFKDRVDLEILSIDEDKRKDSAQRKKMINESDITFLCLPDQASREAVSMIENDHTRIIDASTAHRVAPGWVYGFPELSKDHREKIKKAKRVAVPGCYASGFIACVYPLVETGALARDCPLTCHGLSGYSGGGKKMIATMEGANKPAAWSSPLEYALGQDHKHLPEMQAICGLKYKPAFHPIVNDYYNGMIVTISLHQHWLSNSYNLDEIHKIMADYYRGRDFLKVMDPNGKEILTDGFMPANVLAGTNNMEIFVCGNDERMSISARFDNLGKGASGAAVQCMNIMLGIDETTGLI